MATQGTHTDWARSGRNRGLFGTLPSLNGPSPSLSIALLRDSSVLHIANAETYAEPENDVEALNMECDREDDDFRAINLAAALQRVSVRGGGTAVRHI